MTLSRKTPMKRTPLRSSSTTKEPKPPTLRQRKCSNCGNPFKQSRMGQQVCSAACAQSFARRLREQKERKERKEGLAKLKRRADYYKEAQAALNAWIRLVRDKDKPCISCGRFHEGQWHAGHYLARGSHPNLALVEANLARQCQPCNVHLSGNQIQFRRGLVERIGLEAVEALESDNMPRKYTVDELQAIKAHYRARLREAPKAA